MPGMIAIWFINLRRTPTADNLKVLHHIATVTNVEQMLRFTIELLYSLRPDASMDELKMQVPQGGKRP